MNAKRPIPLPLVLLAALAACQDVTAPDAPLPWSNQSVAAGCTPNSDTCDDTGGDVAGSYVFRLESLDVGTLVLTGTNLFGQTTSAAFTAASVFRPANPNMMPPNPIYPDVLPPNPIREYNEALGNGLGDTFAIYTAISNLVAARLPARVWIDKQAGTIRAFRPIN